MTSNYETCKPEWMSNSFFENALRSAEGDNITVISTEVKAATAAGDHYGSNMYRVVVKFRHGTKIEEISVIVKVSKQESQGIIAKMMSVRNLFDQETAAFSIMFPAMYKLLDEVPSLNNQPFSAKYLYSDSHETASSIVLEDLKVKGFRLADNRTSGLDVKHCLLVMRTIARYHAASLVQYQKDPTIFEPLMDNVFSIDKDNGLKELFEGNISRVAKEVDTWPEYKDTLAKRLYNLRDTTMEKWRLGYTRNGEFNVLCHGDLWLNNLMFRYSGDTAEIEDFRFVDFQLTYWTSPAVDLHYFMYTSASAEALEHSELLIQEYYNTLCEILTLLKHPQLQPTMSMINEELEKRGFFAVLCSIVVRSVVMVDRSNFRDVDGLVEEKEVIHLTEEYKRSLKNLLFLFDARGWI
ncbi:uncharacterized protein [Periplaneta americana]|uniref:uncharacterized protein n=1 Tax=Periplaneta americana TaxID=6978 RepID=UPI0037E913B6